MHVAIVGGGIVGQVIGWRLAVRGHRVTVVEPLGPGNVRSGSGDRSRIVRALYDDEAFARSGHASLAKWRSYEAELGVKLVEPIGALYFDREGSEPSVVRFRAFIDRGVAHVRALGGSIEEIGLDDIRARWPAIATTGLVRAVLEPGAGFGRAALAARTVARAALATGHVTHVGGAARRIVVEGGAARAVEVAVGGDTERVDPAEALTRIDADAVVVAAAAAGVALVRPFLAGDLAVRRIPHFTTYWDVPYPAAAGLHMASLPVWVDLGSDLYGIPDDGDAGFKVAWHEPRREVHELADAFAPDEAEIEALRDAASERFPALRHATLRAVYSCVYDATPDERFEIGPVPGVNGLVLATGLSGHGFKHAPVLGEAIADLVAGEPPSFDLSPWALRIGSPSQSDRRPQR